MYSVECQKPCKSVSTKNFFKVSTAVFGKLYDEIRGVIKLVLLKRLLVES
jgi:hypothetical protein